MRCDLGVDVVFVKFIEDLFVVLGWLVERYFDGFEKCVKYDYWWVYINEDSLREFGY